MEVIQSLLSGISTLKPQSGPWTPGGHEGTDLFCHSFYCLLAPRGLPSILGQAVEKEKAVDLPLISHTVSLLSPPPTQPMAGNLSTTAARVGTEEARRNGPSWVERTLLEDREREKKRFC